MNLGREEGYNIAKEAFDGMVKKLKARETSKKVSTANSGSQMDCQTTTITVCTQTTPEMATTTSVCTQTNSSTPAGSFAKNHQKVKNPVIFTQKPPEPFVSGSFNLAEDTHSSQAPTTIITAFEMRSAPASFMKNHQKNQNFSRFGSFQRG